jgi:apolipoprotein N-acyltransferase
VLHPFDLELVAGGPHAVPDVPNAYRNSAFAIDPSGEVRARYDKERLLPFAEYHPLGSLGAVRRSFGGVRAFVPGEASPPPLPTVAGRAGILICNEAMFPELARARVRAGAELLLVLTNDTWVAAPSSPASHSTWPCSVPSRHDGGWCARRRRDRRRSSIRRAPSARPPRTMRRRPSRAT